jgi:MauM/NapG family ferredoxin protein
MVPPDASRLRRCIQAASLLGFLWLLSRAAFPEAGPGWTDLFLRLDPLAATAIPLVAREWIPRLLPGLGIVLLAILAGRLFCGYICPLGTTLDLARGLTDGAMPRKNREAPALPGLALLKYLLLALVLGAAAAGENLAFWFSPVALATRLYALLLHPLLLLAGHEALNLGRPVFDALGMSSLSYMQLELRRFDTLYALLAFFGLLFTLARVRPRFWCRYLCPAGALLGICSLRPVWRRRVGNCAGCGRCVRGCPTGAILPDGAALPNECIVCRACAAACPVREVRFACRERTGDSRRAHGDPLPARRAFLSAAGAGVVLAAVGHANPGSLLLPRTRGLLFDPGCVRPPGALPEPAFLDRCLRCGQCMKACPTNALQPAWFAAGVEGMFSPVLVARLGPCEPSCRVCGLVCPTGAIAPLPLEQKQQAKIGTAVINVSTCLAWAEGRSCVVCQEVCPYGAIAFTRAADAKAPLPAVEAARCFGCGYCEHHCPVRVPAVTVLPLNALRLATAGYIEAAQQAGLRLRHSTGTPYGENAPPDIPPGALPPGFSE